MSAARQTCPLCDWRRWVELPGGLTDTVRDTLLTHVARSLQWEWQAHVMREHSSEMVNAYDVLTLAGFDHWVSQEGQQPTVEETPPGEGEGQTVRTDLPTITPEQAKQLAEAVERAMLSAADGIQRFAEHMVPALHAAQQNLTDGLRRIVEQSVERRSADVLRAAATLAPGTRGPEFWKSLYGNTPVVQPSCQCDGTRTAHLRGDPGCLFLDAAGTLNPDTRPYGTVDAEICSNCQRLAGEPHGLPSCAELS